MGGGAISLLELSLMHRCVKVRIRRDAWLGYSGPLFLIVRRPSASSLKSPTPQDREHAP
jgi:hypothetical protein